ncbi:protein of unknown function [Candidatus Methylocalor cossyra]|uniref:Uncharacterized protein n=1 Tax=Candidatus Methylocalor cossyra TaxID=3108543 RepID=A0ABM9NLV9_9GAMM
MRKYHPFHGDWDCRPDRGWSWRAALNKLKCQESARQPLSEPRVRREESPGSTGQGAR